MILFQIPYCNKNKMNRFQGSTALHTKRLRLRKIRLADTEVMFRMDYRTIVSYVI